jgi:lactoylglutathione lyase
MPSITRTHTPSRAQAASGPVNRHPCPTRAQIESIALATDDVENLRDFYLQLGAIPARPSTDPGTDLGGSALDFCGVRLEWFERPRDGHGATGGGHSPGLLHLGFALGSADAVDELSRILAAAGHRIVEQPHRAGALGRYECVVLDPDGNRLMLTV